ncbi:MAG: hypothetical protein U0559_00550 [Anaerolineae bacterium]
MKNKILSFALSLGMLLSLLLGGSFVPLAAAAPAAGCQLDTAHGRIQHVIQIQFDNTHFTRDNPNVPSDLEQMPHLLNFIKNNGVLLSNHHTPLISHTATDILTTLTGVYGDRHGVPVSNSFRYFLPNGTTNTGVSFAYWTSPLFDPSNPVSPTDTLPNMLTADGHNAPAPWVPFTRAGCNFGAVATANTILENTAIDIPTVFGAGSPEALEVTANPAQAFADFVGIGIHCAAGDVLCSAANNGKADRLPDEPGGYTGFNGLFGHKYVAAQISPSAPLTDLDGNVIQDPTNHIGFPGFDGMSASVSLAYVAAMQEHGVPVTYAYISDAHDKHPTGPAYGPGEAGFVAALAAYDSAFDKFFTRLANDGINASNTLFIFTADENDHFVGGTPTNPCDGVNTPCVYSHVNCPSATVPVCPSDNVGELNANMAGLLATEQGVTTPFRVHSDDAPTVYLTGNPTRTDPTLRTFERATAQLTATNYYKGVDENMTVALADPVEMKLLHMVTADPARTPSFTWFAKPDYFVFAGAANCATPCVQEQFGFAWNHGDVTPDITRTWLGIAGPGIAERGVDHETWSDHTDVRPTVLSLVGLKDDYMPDGRVLVEIMSRSTLPRSLKGEGSLYAELARIYKQINAPVGQLGLASLQASTQAVQSGNASDDSLYTRLETQLQMLTADRDVLADQMKTMLFNAAFNGQPLPGWQLGRLISQGERLLERARHIGEQHDGEVNTELPMPSLSTPVKAPAAPLPNTN